MLLYSHFKSEVALHSPVSSPRESSHLGLLGNAPGLVAIFCLRHWAAHTSRSFLAVSISPEHSVDTHFGSFLWPASFCFTC